MKKKTLSNLPAHLLSPKLSMNFEDKQPSTPARSQEQSCLNILLGSRPTEVPLRNMPLQDDQDCSVLTFLDLSSRPPNQFT